jgi:hypothetical protein
MKPDIDQIAFWQNCKLMSGQVDDYVSWQNSKLTKCQGDEKDEHLNSTVHYDDQFEVGQTHSRPWV